MATTQGDVESRSCSADFCVAECDGYEKVIVDPGLGLKRDAGRWRRAFGLRTWVSHRKCCKSDLSFSSAGTGSVFAAFCFFTPQVTGVDVFASSHIYIGV